MTALDFLNLRNDKNDDYFRARSQGFCESCGFYSAEGRVFEDKLQVCLRCEQTLNKDRISKASAFKRVERVEYALDGKRFLLVTAAIISNEKGQILIAEREHSAHGGPAWEFPGGKAEQGEGLSDCLCREIREELDIEITEPTPFMMVDHQYEAFDIRLCAFETTIAAGRLDLREHREVKWVLPAHLDQEELSGADVYIAKAIISR